MVLWLRVIAKVNKGQISYSNSDNESQIKNLYVLADGSSEIQHNSEKHKNDPILLRLSGL